MTDLAGSVGVQMSLGQVGVWQRTREAAPQAISLRAQQLSMPVDGS